MNLFCDGGLIANVEADVSGIFSFTTESLSDGLHSLTATATDVAGNESAISAPVEVVVDTVPTDRPILSSPANGIAVNISPTLVWEVVSDVTAVTYHVQVDDEPGFASPEVDVSDIAETQLVLTLSDGVWFWWVQASDAVGNVSDFHPAFQFTLDTLAPDTPVITNPEIGAILRETSLTISGTAESSSHVDIYDNQQMLGKVFANADGRFALVIQGLLEGEHTLTAKATDVAGNESDFSNNPFSVDITPPTVLLTYPNGGELFRGGDSIDITWEPAVDAHLADNPISLFYSLAGLDGWIPIAENLPNDGIYTWNIPQVNSQAVRVKVIAVDMAGNVGEDASDTEFTIDSEVPMSQLTLIAPSKEQTQYLRGGSTYTIVWSLPQDNFELADVALCYSTDGGNTWHSIDSVTDSGAIYGQYDWNVPALDSGQVVIRIEAIDVSGNEAEDVSGNHVIDSSAPEVLVLTPIDSPTAQNVLTLTGTAEAFSQVSLLRNENQIASIQADASGNFSFTTAPLADGLHSFTATATDVAGNISSASVPVDVIVDTLAPNKPIIVSPESGTILSGTAITISGTAEPESRVDVYDNEQMIGFDITDADGVFELSNQVFNEGEHTLTAIATDAAGNASEISESVTLIVVDLVLIVQFTWVPEPQDEGAPVQFTNTSTSSPDEIVSFSWDFGDENTSSEENPSYAYGDNSTYTVTLTVATAGGSTDTVSHDVTINNVEPVVEAGADQTVDKRDEVNCNATFTDPGQMDTHTATIDWGDGIVEPGNVIEQEGSGTVSGNHTYTDYGLYTVNVVVTDDDGASTSGTFKVTILPSAFKYALFGNTGKLAIKKWATVSGDVFNHGDVEVKEEAVIDGLLFSTGEVTGQGTYTLGELPEPLPELPVLDTTPYEFKLSEASLQPESDLISDSIDLLGETILVNGEVVLTASGNITGPGVIVATKNIQIKEDSNIGEGIILIAGGKIDIYERVVSATSLDNSFFSEEGIEIKNESQIAGVLLSLEKVEMKEHTIFNGLVYATGTVKIKAESEIEGSVVAHKLKEINEGASVTYNESTAQELSTKIFIEGEELAQAPAAFVLTKFIQRETKLAQNYPNPFNPETWIPYRLAKDADVIIEIYNISGQLTRTLYLGNQNAGNYLGKGDAAYWDGRNSSGQKVASGLYFYTLQAGDFSAVRKIILVK